MNTKTQQKEILGLNLCHLTGLRVSCFATSCCCRRLHISCRSSVTFANTPWIPYSISDGTRCLCLGNWIKLLTSSQAKLGFEFKNKQTNKPTLHGEFPPLPLSLTDSCHYSVLPIPPGSLTNSAPGFATSIGKITRTLRTTGVCVNKLRKKSKHSKSTATRKY